MTDDPRHPAHDQLQAKVQLIERRIDGLNQRIEDLAEEVGSSMKDRAGVLLERSRALRATIADWAEVKVGVPSEVEGLSADVDAIEADIDAATPQEVAGYEVAVDRQLRVWRGRLDHLRLQRTLAAMEARDDLEALGDRLDTARGDALVELQSAAAGSKDLVADVRRGLEGILGDVRRAAEKAAADLTDR